jgi:hypothetical protein
LDCSDGLLTNTSHTEAVDAGIDIQTDEKLSFPNGSQWDADVCTYLYVCPSDWHQVWQAGTGST